MAPRGAQPRRAAQYLRMSTEHQRYSTENQSDAIAHYAEQRAEAALPLAPFRSRHVRLSNSSTEPFILRLRQIAGKACDSMELKHRRGGSEKCFLRWARLFQMTTKGRSID